jgi:hypothetical protein
MDYFVKGALVVISSVLIFIAVQAYQINEAFKMQPPTIGEYQDASAITDPAAKKVALEELQKRTPLVRIRGGSVEVSGGSLDVSGSSVDVTGSVSISGPVYTYE